MFRVDVEDSGFGAFRVEEVSHGFQLGWFQLGSGAWVAGQRMEQLRERWWRWRKARSAEGGGGKKEGQGSPQGSPDSAT